MGARIATIQRQARELGRLRTGYTDTSKAKPRPVRSQTWVITSHAEHYVRAAAEVWGGKPETWQPLGNGAQQWRVITEAASLDAILPPGDPLSQSYELWSRGGCQRRCDGMTESLSDQPCPCRAEWGEAFHETAPRDEACKMTTRLNVMLPGMPDIGAWRVETHSYYSANEMAAAVDMLKGAIGERGLIPVRLRIEQRTRVSQGQTRHFPVVAVELRGATAGEVLAGTAPTVALAAGRQPAAVEGGRPAIGAPDLKIDFVAAIGKADTRDKVVELWQQAKAANVPNGQAVEAAAKRRVSEMEEQAQAQSAGPERHIAAAKNAQTADELTVALKAAQEDGCATELGDQSDPVAVAFVERRREMVSNQPADGDKDALWSQIVATWPGDRTADIEHAFAERYAGETPGTASAELLAEFLTDLKAGIVQPATAESGEAVPF